MSEPDQPVPGVARRAVSHAAQLIRQANFVVAYTGAGLSAESGVPSSRGRMATWDEFEPEECASVRGFEADPAKVRRWYDDRRRQIARAQPNAGHEALAELEREVPEFFVITCNIDGLQQKAGSRNVFELCGSIWRDRCPRCGFGRELGPENSQSECRCPRCGHWLRPGVTWPDEAAADVAFEAGLEAAQRSELVLTVGTCGSVQPVASLLLEAKATGATVINVAPDLTDTPKPADVVLPGPASRMLPELVKQLHQMTAQPH